MHVAVQPERHRPVPEPEREHPGAAGHPGHDRACGTDDAGAHRRAAGAASHTPDLGWAGQGGPALRRRGRRRGGAGLRLQPAGLGAAAGRPGAGRGCSATAAPSAASRRTSTRRCWSTSAPPPRPRSSGRSPTLAHALRRGAAIGAAGVVFHAGSAVDAGPRRRGAAARSARRCCRCSTRPPRPAGRSCWSSRAPAAAGRSPPGSSTSAPYLDAVDRPPVARGLLRHLPRLGGRARPGRAGRHDRDPGRAGRHGRARTGCGWCTPTTPRTRAARPRDRHENIGKGTHRRGGLRRADGPPGRPPASR